MIENQDIVKSRAWVEVRLDHLMNNIKEIQKIMAKDSKIMAVVKANAYGHGMVEVSLEMNRMGIFDFAVATLEEGILLRKHGVMGNILILGYTSMELIPLVLQYDLIQTVVDSSYALALSSKKLPFPLKAHLKVNTGMNRIGISYLDILEFEKIYHYENLSVLGFFSHLCVADSQKEEDILFTRKQIENFNSLISRLRADGYDVGKVHLQNSYGLLNYPEVTYDYVRMGILMYGFLVDKYSYPKMKVELKPVLSLKARVSSVKTIEEQECVGYGRTYCAMKKEKIATVSIGYADGYPRGLSNCGVVVLVRGNYAPIVGRICMDQLMILVTDIEGVSVGDVVTLIGDDPLISVEELAERGKTITNELLSRLGNRLPRVFLNSEEL